MAKPTPAPATKGPLAILQAYIAPLSHESGGLVTAEIAGLPALEKQDLAASFYLVGPVIHFRYLLFSIQYPSESNFPLSLYAEIIADKPIAIADADALEKELRQIFAHPKTRQIVDAIVARSQ